MSLHRNGAAFITGASSGIGAAYAQRLARRGYDLTLIARNRQQLDALAAQISDETGRAVEVLQANLCNEEDLTRIETSLKQDASLTMLVNVEGIDATSPLHESNVDMMEEMIRVNVLALTRLTYSAASAFATRAKGTIVNVSSTFAIFPDLLNGVYAGTKAFVLALSQSLHHELADKGVRVQVVLPGVTSMAFRDIAEMPLGNLPGGTVMTVEEMVDAALAGLDLGELVTIPSLPDISDWEAFEAARRKLIPNLSRAHPAARYRVRPSSA